jgi:hypothetical protein
MVKSVKGHDITFSVENISIGSMLNKQDNHGEMTLAGGPVDRGGAKFSPNCINEGTLKKNYVVMLYQFEIEETSFEHKVMNNSFLDK